MPAGRPWYQKNPADFIMAVRGWPLEEAGAYGLIIDHLNDRDRPLPDDDRFMASILNCSKQRWRKIRRFLLDHNKILITEDGYITNPRFEREKADRLTTRADAIEHGRKGGQISAAKRAGQAELPLARTRTEPSKTSGKVATKLKESSNFVASKPEEPEEKPNKINDPIEPPPQAPYAREESRDKRRVESPPTLESAQGRLSDADLKTQFDAVCEAAGFVPVSPAQIDLNLRQVEDWVKLGVDLDEVAIPTIQAIIAKSSEPTRTLGRFRSAIAHEHAKRKANGTLGRGYRPPAKPNLTPKGEAEIFKPIREALLESLGPEVYCLYANPVTFHDIREDGWNRSPMRLDGPEHSTEPLKRGRYRTTLLAIANRHGFDELW